MDRFAQILYDLGKEVGTNFYPDENQICQLDFQNQLKLQIQFDEVKEMVLVASFICDVPPGKYREKLLKEALKSNSDSPRPGILAYSERNNKLTLYEYLTPVGLTGGKLFKFLEQFLEKALSWKDAVENGKPLPTTSPRVSKGDSMFGLKP